MLPDRFWGSTRAGGRLGGMQGSIRKGCAALESPQPRRRSRKGQDEQNYEVASPWRMMERAASPQPGGGTDDGGHHKAYRTRAGVAGVRTGCSAPSRATARGCQTKPAIARAKQEKRGGSSGCGRAESPSPAQVTSAALESQGSSGATARAAPSHQSTSSTASSSFWRP